MSLELDYIVLRTAEIEIWRRWLLRELAAVPPEHFSRAVSAACADLAALDRRERLMLRRARERGTP